MVMFKSGKLAARRVALGDATCEARESMPVIPPVQIDMPETLAHLTAPVGLGAFLEHG